jgi:hypothetical protein
VAKCALIESRQEGCKSFTRGALTIDLDGLIAAESFIVEVPHSFLFRFLREPRPRGTKRMLADGVTVDLTPKTLQIAGSQRRLTANGVRAGVCDI